MDTLTLGEIVRLTAPLIVAEVLLKGFCLFKLAKDEVKYLPKAVWALLILLITTFGSLAYLIIGRKKY